MSEMWERNRFNHKRPEWLHGVCSQDRQNGDYDYDSSDGGFSTDDTLNDFRCPECNDSLFPDSEDDAVEAFLRGEIEARYDEKEDCVVIEKRNETTT